MKRVTINERKRTYDLQSMPYIRYLLNVGLIEKITNHEYECSPDGIYIIDLKRNVNTELAYISDGLSMSFDQGNIIKFAFSVENVIS